MVLHGAPQNARMPRCPSLLEVFTHGCPRLVSCADRLTVLTSCFTLSQFVCMGAYSAMNHSLESTELVLDTEGHKMMSLLQLLQPRACQNLCRCYQEGKSKTQKNDKNGSHVGAHRSATTQAHLTCMHFTQDAICGTVALSSSWQHAGAFLDTRWYKMIQGSTKLCPAKDLLGRHSK